MRTLSATATLLFILSGFLSAQSNFSESEKNWTQWRGPHETGVAPNGNPPTEWSETTNVKWKSEIPGIGHATPIIWKDQMILLSAIKTNKMSGEKEAEEGKDENDWMNANSTDLIH